MEETSLKKTKVVYEKYRLKKMAKLAEKYETVLDVGCADIQNPYLLNKTVVGFDINSAEVIKNYTNFVQGDVMQLPYPFEPSSFDVILAGEIIEHLYNPHDFLIKCYDTIKPNGKIILSTPNPNSPIERLLTLWLSRKYFYAKDHVCLYPQRWLVRMLEDAGFVDVSLISGGMTMLYKKQLVPFPRPWCYQTIAIAYKK